MHYISNCTLLIILLIFITAHAAPSSKSLIIQQLCPDEYPELWSRQVKTNAELNDDDGDDYYDDNDVDESRETLCEEAMNMIVRHRNIEKLNPAILLNYCPHYDERLALVLANINNTTLTGNQKQVFKIQRYDDFIDSNDDDSKRRALRKRQLKKRFALRFIRKRMS